MKRAVQTIAVVVILFLRPSFPGESREKRTPSRSEQRVILTRYQHDVPLGTQRADVKKFLDAQKTPYRDVRVIVVDLGREPGNNFACDYWKVHIDFEFGLAQPNSEASPQDALTAISLKRIGHCL